MQAHGADLRGEVKDDAEGAALVEALFRDWRDARLAPADRALLAFAVKLTQTPGKMSEQDIAALRRAGFGDMAIHDTVQITALFNYYNRLADGLGIDPEEDGTGDAP